MAKLDSLPTEIILHVAQCKLAWSNLLQASCREAFLRVLTPNSVLSSESAGDS